jgi:Mg2+/citrate symporter
MSFGTTLTISMLTERLVVIPGSIVLGIGFAAVLSPTLVGIAMAAVHSVLRTPEIMVTVAPTMIVGFVYTTIYATIVGLEENRRRNSAHAESMGRPSAG